MYGAKYYNFEKDYFYSIFHKNFLKKIKKNIFFEENHKFIRFSKNLGAKFFKFFKKKKKNFLENKICGLRFRPFLFSEEKILKKKLPFSKIFQQKNYENGRKKKPYKFIKFRKFHTSLFITDKKIQTSFVRISDKKIFEETANDLRFFLDIELIKIAISRAPILICFWLFCGNSWHKTRSFWFYYFSSCFYSMIRYQRQSVKIEFKKKYENFDFFKICTEKDSEFLYFSEKKNNFDIRSSSFIPKNTIIGIKNEEIGTDTNLNQKKFSFAWRNRFFKKTLLNFSLKKIKSKRVFGNHMFFG